MLICVKGLHAAAIHANDGEIGKMDEALFDDQYWTIRYLIVDTGNWLSSRKVLLSPISFVAAEWKEPSLRVNLTREQIKNSPDVSTDQPVSRQWETKYHEYYDWPSYWNGMGAWGAGWYPGALLTHSLGYLGKQEQKATSEAVIEAQGQVDYHLRSTKEVTGYALSAIDGHLGHVFDFIVDDQSWMIRFLAVDLGHWLPGRKVLIPPEWIEDVNWIHRTVAVNVTRTQVQNCPEWVYGEPISRAYENELYQYYVRQRPKFGD